MNQEAILCQLAGTLALQTLDGDQVEENAWPKAFQLAAAQYEVLTGTTVGRALNLPEDELTLGVPHAMPKLRERLHVRLESDLTDLMPVYTRYAIPPAYSHDVKPAGHRVVGYCVVGIIVWTPGHSWSVAACTAQALGISSLRCGHPMLLPVPPYRLHVWGEVGPSRYAYRGLQLCSENCTA